MDHPEGKAHRLGKAGLVTRCPFHGGDAPTFSIDPEKGLYHCPVCGASGEAVFLQEEGAVAVPADGAPRPGKLLAAEAWGGVSSHGTL